MPGPSPIVPKEQVVVRHIVERKRKDVSDVSELLRAPFQSNGSCIHSQDTSIDGNPGPGRWLIAARFDKHAWLGLYSNAATGKELYEANASSRRLEVAWFGYDPQMGWFFKLKVAGNPVVDFEQRSDNDTPAKFLANSPKDNCLKKGESGEKSLERLCKHFDIPRDMPQVRAEQGSFQIIGVKGKPIKSGLRGYVRIDGPALAAGENKAADALDKAIDRRDADGIRKAIARGASLTALPDSSCSPLLSALYQCDKPGWEKCVEVLLELGCRVNGEEGAPPIVDCVESFIAEEHALKTLELLVKHGADVNRRDERGDTAIYNCVLDKRIKLMRWLMQNGADPNITGRYGQSAIEFVRQKMADESGFSERTACAEILSLLTGEPVEKPRVDALRPELKAENERFRQIRARKRAPTGEPTNLDGIVPPRYDRLGFFFDFSDWDDPSFSTEKWAQNIAKDIGDEDPRSSVQSAAILAAMRHMQFAGAPKGFDFVDRGCDWAVTFMKQLAKQSSRAPAWQIRQLAEGLLLCALAARWRTFEQICDLVPPGLMSVDTRDEENMDYAQVLFIFISSFRGRSLPKLDAVESKVRKGRDKREKVLLEVFQASLAGKQEPFAKALQRSLEAFVESRDGGYVMYRGSKRWVNDMFQVVSLADSLLYLAALKRGLQPVELPQHLADMLMTPETVGCLRN